MSYFLTNSNLLKPFGFSNEFGQIAMWSGSGLLALHALHALQLNLAAEADKGLRVRSSELVDMHESKTCTSSECFVSGCKFTGTEVRWEYEDINEA